VGFSRRKSTIEWGPLKGPLNEPSCTGATSPEGSHSRSVPGGQGRGRDRGSHKSRNRSFRLSRNFARLALYEDVLPGNPAKNMINPRMRVGTFGCLSFRLLSELKILEIIHYRV